MSNLKTTALVVALTLIFQFVAEHIMRALLNQATSPFIYSMAGAMGHLALIMVKLFKREGQE